MFPAAMQCSAVGVVVFKSQYVIKSGDRVLFPPVRFILGFPSWFFYSRRLSFACFHLVIFDAIQLSGPSTITKKIRSNFFSKCRLYRRQPQTNLSNDQCTVY